MSATVMHSTDVLSASGSGGQPPRKPGRDPFGNTGHYAPKSSGPFRDLTGIKMADPREKRRGFAPIDQAPFRRRRANSMPALNGDGSFYGVFRSVMTNGILPQTEMRRRGIGFNPSHDSNRRMANNIEVTRVRGGMGYSIDSSQKSGRAAVSNAHHGALTVALESGANELDFRQQTDSEVRNSLTLDQRFAMLAMDSDTQRMVLNGNRQNVLTAQGRHDARERMHSNFMVFANASNPTIHSATEQMRNSITPSQMTNVAVPMEHHSTARRVFRDLSVREHTPFPNLTGVHSAQNLQPDYHTRRGDSVAINGIMSPGYHQTVTSNAIGGDTDIHLVRVNQGGGNRSQRRIGRARANTV